MPWVRLHGTKDYLGMAMHLEEVPEFRCTINLVPSLLVQIEAYVGGATDKHLMVSRMPADGLARDDALYLLDNFFMAYADAMIQPPPPLLRALPAAGAGRRLRRAGAGPLPRARPPRPPGLVQPRVVPPDALREGPGTRRVQGQGPPLHRGRERPGSWTSSARSSAGSSPCTASSPSGAGRADDDPVLPPDHPPPAGQAAGPRGDARRQPAGLPRRLSRGRRVPRPRRRRVHREHFGAAPAGCGPARGR